MDYRRCINERKMDASRTQEFGMTENEFLSYTEKCLNERKLNEGMLPSRERLMLLIESLGDAGFKKYIATRCTEPDDTILFGYDVVFQVPISKQFVPKQILSKIKRYQDKFKGWNFIELAFRIYAQNEKNVRVYFNNYLEPNGARSRYFLWSNAWYSPYNKVPIPSEYGLIKLADQMNAERNIRKELVKIEMPWLNPRSGIPVVNAFYIGFMATKQDWISLNLKMPSKTQVKKLIEEAMEIKVEYEITRRIIVSYLSGI